MGYTRKKTWANMVPLLALMILVTGCAAPPQLTGARQGPQLAISCDEEISAQPPCAGQLAMVATGLARPDLHKAVIGEDGAVLPSQWVDTDADGVVETLYFRVPEDTANSVFSLTNAQPPEFDARAQAILSQRIGGSWNEGKLNGGQFADIAQLDVPDWHKQGTNFLRYEGPAWESELVAYRLYLDVRNGTDIFGKKVDALALHDHGYDGDNYHELKAWGADILKVGESLGIGALGHATADGIRRIKATKGISAKILDNGPLFSRFHVDSRGVEIGQETTDIVTSYSIMAGSRLTHVRAESDKAVKGWATGLAKHERAQFIQSTGDGPWSYIATFGRQSLFDDNLGMAIFYRTSDASIVESDKLNEAVAFQGARKNIEYYFSAVWAQDPSRIDTLQEFTDYLEQERSRLAAPLLANKKN